MIEIYDDKDVEELTNTVHQLFLEIEREVQLPDTWSQKFGKWE